MEICKIDYQDQDTVLEATVAYKKTSEKKPVVLIFPAWEGKGGFTEQKAQALAELGYIGCALDPYGKGKFGETKDACRALMAPFMQDVDARVRRIQAYQSLLPSLPQADTSKIAAIGFCFGGLCALDLARTGAPLKGVVSFHGLLKNSPFSSAIQAKILALHGAKDPMASKEDLYAFCQELEEKQADYQLHIFGNAMHAFTNPKANDLTLGTVYHPISDIRSWRLMSDFLKEVFMQ